MMAQTMLHLSNGKTVTVRESPQIVEGKFRASKVVVLTRSDGRMTEINADNIIRTAGAQ
jgi:hypothetical protein